MEITIKELIADLADRCLNHPGNADPCDGLDMVNTVLIHQYVLMSLLRQYGEKNNLTAEQQMVLAEQAAIKLRHIIFLTTGMDLAEHIIAKCVAASVFKMVDDTKNSA